jgi:hypothetical protein
MKEKQETSNEKKKRLRKKRMKRKVDERNGGNLKPSEETEYFPYARTSGAAHRGFTLKSIRIFPTSPSIVSLHILQLFSYFKRLPISNSESPKSPSLAIVNTSAS